MAIGWLPEAGLVKQLSRRARNLQIRRPVKRPRPLNPGGPSTKRTVAAQLAATPNLIGPCASLTIGASRTP
jgi:hypothetical protein